MHLEVLKACLSFSFWVMRTKVVPEFGDEHGVVREPGCMLTGGEGEFKPIEHSPVETLALIGSRMAEVYRCRNCQIGLVP